MPSAVNDGLGFFLWQQTNNKHTMVLVGSSDAERMQRRIDYLKSRKDELKQENSVLLDRIRYAYDLVVESERKLLEMAEMQQDQSRTMAAALRGLTAWIDEVEGQVDEVDEVDDDESDESDAESVDTEDTEEYLYGGDN